MLKLYYFSPSFPTFSGSSSSSISSSSNSFAWETPPGFFSDPFSFQSGEERQHGGGGGEWGEGDSLLQQKQKRDSVTKELLKVPVFNSANRHPLFRPGKRDSGTEKNAATPTSPYQKICPKHSAVSVVQEQPMTQSFSSSHECCKCSCHQIPISQPRQQQEQLEQQQPMETDSFSSWMLQGHPLPRQTFPPHSVSTFTEPPPLPPSRIQVPIASAAAGK